MKNLIYAFLFLLVIGLSTGTAKAQSCTYPYPAVYYADVGDPGYDCVGDGQHGDGPFPMNSQGYCYSSPCQCYDSADQIAGGYYLCLHPPCDGPTATDWNDAALWYYFTVYQDYYQAYSYATGIYGCDPYDWSKVKRPKAPFETEAPVIEARALSPARPAAEKLVERARGSRHARSQIVRRFARAESESSLARRRGL